MAVYTPLERGQLEQLLAPYKLGELVAFEGVSAGVENTNYFVTLAKAGQQQTCVLTIFEQIQAADLQFYCDLTTMLAERGLPVPAPIADSAGKRLSRFEDKPALLVPKVRGSHPDTPTLEQCKALGATLAEVHLACLNWPVKHPGIRNLDWMKHVAAQLTARIPAAEQALLQEIDYFEDSIANLSLPQAIIHGDLFRDNALFDGNTLTGLIDFNSAGDGFLMFDLAVVVNDWCTSPKGNLEHERAVTLLNAYQQIRPVTLDEREHWNDFLRIAAFRFWLSRRYTQLRVNADKGCGALVVEKDPAEYQLILQQRIAKPELLPLP